VSANPAIDFLIELGKRVAQAAMTKVKRKKPGPDVPKIDPKDLKR
jgi:hypothetical protein